MSYTILYRSTFVRLSDGNYIPMVECGDNNCYVGSKRSRDWNQYLFRKKGRISFSREEIEKAVEDIIQEEKDTYVGRENRRWPDTGSDVYTEGDIEKYFSYFSGMTIYGHSGASAQQIRNFFKKGIENSVSFDEDPVTLRLEWGYFEDYGYIEVRSEQEFLEEWNRLCQEGKTGLRVDYEELSSLLLWNKLHVKKARKPRLCTTCISLKNPESLPERVMNFRDYEKVAKVGERIILDGSGIISGLANASRASSYKVVGSNQNGLLLKRYGCRTRVYVKDYYKDQKVAVLSSVEFNRLPL